MGRDIAEVCLHAEFRSGYKLRHNFYEPHKLAVDELEAFDYDAHKKNDNYMKHLGDFPLTLETKTEK